MTPLETAWLTYSHRNKRFGHIPARRSTRAHTVRRLLRGAERRRFSYPRTVRTACVRRPGPYGGQPRHLCATRSFASHGAYRSAALTPGRHHSVAGHKPVSTLGNFPGPGLSPAGRCGPSSGLPAPFDGTPVSDGRKPPPGWNVPTALGKRPPRSGRPPCAGDCHRTVERPVKRLGCRPGPKWPA